MGRKNRLLYSVAQPLLYEVELDHKHQTQQTQNKTKLNVKTLRQHSLTTFTFVEKAVLSTHNLSVRKQVAEWIRSPDHPACMQSLY